MLMHSIRSVGNGKYNAFFRSYIYYWIVYYQPKGGYDKTRLKLF
jgi:hypothetical protein